MIDAISMKWEPTRKSYGRCDYPAGLAMETICNSMLAVSKKYKMGLYIGRNEHLVDTHKPYQRHLTIKLRAGNADGLIPLT